MGVGSAIGGLMQAGAQSEAARRAEDVERERMRIQQEQYAQQQEAQRPYREASLSALSRLIQEASRPGLSSFAQLQKREAEQGLAKGLARTGMLGKSGAGIRALGGEFSRIAADDARQRQQMLGQLMGAGAPPMGFNQAPTPQFQTPAGAVGMSGMGQTISALSQLPFFASMMGGGQTGSGIPSNLQFQAPGQGVSGYLPGYVPRVTV